MHPHWSRFIIMDWVLWFTIIHVKQIRLIVWIVCKIIHLSFLASPECTNQSFAVLCLASSSVYFSLQKQQLLLTVHRRNSLCHKIRNWKIFVFNWELKQKVKTSYQSVSEIVFSIIKICYVLLELIWILYIPNFLNFIPNIYFFLGLYPRLCLWFALSSIFCDAVNSCFWTDFTFLIDIHSPLVVCLQEKCFCTWLSSVSPFVV